MFSGYGDLDLEGLIDEDPPPSTKRMPGSSTFHVEDKITPLFISATWVLTATVKDNNGEIVIHKSSDSPTAHTQSFIKRWARQVIRSNKDQLRKMGVDVEKAYQEWDGEVDDLV